eukprot:11024783-Heterocapsa_arctica.AAC.1
MGGGILAEAPALEEQKDREMFKAMGCDGKELMVVIRLEGEQVGARKDEVKDFVRMMATVANIQLKHEAVEVVKDPYQWTLIQDARHGWRGDIMVKLAKKEE